jgi:hypothetical protein
LPECEALKQFQLVIALYYDICFDFSSLYSGKN